MRSATQGEKAALVQELHKEGHRLNDLLDAIGLSRSTYYYELGRTDKVKERNADLSSEIVSIFNENMKANSRSFSQRTNTKAIISVFKCDIVKISWHIFLKDITDYAATSKAS